MSRLEKAMGNGTVFKEALFAKWSFWYRDDFSLGFIGEFMPWAYKQKRDNWKCLD